MEELSLLSAHLSDNKTVLQALRFLFSCKALYDDITVDYTKQDIVDFICIFFKMPAYTKDIEHFTDHIYDNLPDLDNSAQLKFDLRFIEQIKPISSYKKCIKYYLQFPNINKSVIDILSENLDLLSNEAPDEQVLCKISRLLNDNPELIDIFYAFYCEIPKLENANCLQKEYINHINKNE